jgi:hypothetical protein
MTTLRELALTCGTSIEKLLQKRFVKRMNSHPRRSLDVQQKLIDALLPLIPAPCDMKEITRHQNFSTHTS